MHVDRHEPSGEERDGWYGGERHRLAERDEPAAIGGGRDLRDVRIDRDDLHADADAREQPPDVDGERAARQRHEQRREGVEDERPRERRPPSELVGDPAEEQRPHEHPGKAGADERRETGRPLGERREQLLAIETERDVRRHEEIVRLEPAACGYAGDETDCPVLHRRPGSRRRRRRSSMKQTNDWRAALERHDDGYFVLRSDDTNGVEVRLFLTPALLETVEENIFPQIRNAAAFPGVKLVVITPDVHYGYGVPVG